MIYIGADAADEDLLPSVPITRVNINILDPRS